MRTTTPHPSYTAAHEYIDRGWPVFPLKPRDKVPATKHGFKDATTDTAQIARWFGNGTAYNVALATGAGAGVVVVDLDGDEGRASWQRALQDHGAVDTLRASTGRGEHWYFKYPGTTVRNRAGILPGVDVRGDGGYVAAPPSVHPNGTAYAWINPEVEIATPPRWLCELLLRPAAKSTTEHYGATLPAYGGSYCRTALDRGAANVRDAREGSRNSTLNKEAYSLAGLLHTGEFTESKLRETLTDAALRAGLPDDEIKRTLDSAIDTGSKEKREIPTVQAQATAQQATPTNESQQDKKQTPTDADVAVTWLSDKQDTSYGMGEFRKYNAGVWQVVSDGTAEAEILGTIESFKSQGVRPTASRLASVKKLAQVKALVDDTLWDSDPDILVCRNGVLHIPTMTLRPHRREDYQTSGLAFDFDPAATAPAFAHVLASTLDPSVIDFVQEFAGYSLTVDTSHELALWFAGPPGSGKSTVILGFQVALGTRCGLLGLADIERSSFALSNLPGRTLMVSTEQPSGYMTASSRLNAIISGEPVIVDRKYRDPVEIRPRAKLLWSMNDIPRVPDANDGIFRRVKVIRFGPLSTPPDLTLKARIATEGAGILNWALAGLRRLRERGRFDIPAAVQNATGEFKLRNDVPACFLDEVCLRGGQYIVQSQALYDAYKAWCLATGHKPQNTNNLADEWERLGITKTRIHGKTYWRGVGLVDQGGRP